MALSPFHETNPNLQFAIDNTSVSTFKDCPQKYFLSIISGWRAPGAAPPLAFGGAYHDCLERYDDLLAKGVVKAQALRDTIRHAFTFEELGDDERRTRLTLVRSLVWYAEQYSSDVLSTHRFANGRVGLEMSFSFELPWKVSGTNDSFIYSGHIDKLALYSGDLYAVERKHTISTLNDQFFSRYTFSGQTCGYVYAGKVVFDIPVAGAIIEATQVATNYSRFGRLVVHRINSHLEEWLQDLNYWTRQMEYCATHNYWPRNTESCSKYNGCQFRKVCGKDPAVRELVLASEFVKRHWNPLETRGD